MILPLVNKSSGGGISPQPELKALIPFMTSNNTPSGIASASSEYGGVQKAYMAFSGADNFWSSNSNQTSTSSAWIKYQFPTAVCACKWYININSTLSSGGRRYALQCSNDNSTWTTLTQFVSETSQFYRYIEFENDQNFIYYRVYIDYHDSTNLWFAISDIQLYGYEVSPEFTPLIPTMTSNTTPSGICSASSKYSTDYEPYKAFDGSYDVLKRWTNVRGESNPWLAYLFPTPVVAKNIEIYQIGAESSTEATRFVVQGSNNTSTWTDLTSTISTALGKNDFSITLNNSTAYTSYRIYFSYLSYPAVGVGITEVQLYN